MSTTDAAENPEPEPPMHPEIARMFAEAVRPPDRRPPWQWCEEHIASIPYSPMPGRFRSDNSPWVREVMEAIVDPRVKLVSILASVQSSKTTIPELTLCYIIKNLPGPCLWLDQTDEDAKDQSESRLQKLFDECEPVRALFPQDRHKKRNHTIHFANGMTLWILGAHSKTNLQRRSIRWLIADETWRFPSGHMAEAEARVTAFGWLGKCVFMSQGGEENDDTHRKFETTDMREWTFTCPHCGRRQAFDWERVEWSKKARDSEGNWDFAAVRASTVLRCAECGHAFADSDATRRQLNATGQFVRTNPNAAPENVGFHWNALCAMSWGKLAELYLRAKAAARQGDTSLLQQFYQKRLALPWREYVEDFKVEIATSDYQLCDEWQEEGGIDAKGRIVASRDAAQIRLRFLTVDVQMDHFWLVVRSWSASGASRLIWCQKALTWEEIEAIQGRFNVDDNLVIVDAGYNSYEVYRQCARHRWTAAMGDARATFPHREGGTPVQRFYSPVRKVQVGRGLRCRMHYWSNLNIKDILARIRHQDREDGQPMWEVPADVPEEYVSQMESERRIKKASKWHWEQIGNRPNHLFDAECMQVLGAVMLKIIGGESVAETAPPS